MRQVHQMRINIRLHNMRQVAHFACAIASLTHLTVHAQYSIAQLTQLRGENVSLDAYYAVIMLIRIN